MPLNWTSPGHSDVPYHPNLIKTFSFPHFGSLGTLLLLLSVPQHRTSGPGLIRKFVFGSRIRPFFVVRLFPATWISIQLARKVLQTRLWLYGMFSNFRLIFIWLTLRLTVNYSKSFGLYEVKIANVMMGVWIIDARKYSLSGHWAGCFLTQQLAWDIWTCCIGGDKQERGEWGPIGWLVFFHNLMYL